ncbi:hypothetical protein ACKWTF_016508 [Chironomus riparius]
MSRQKDKMRQGKNNGDRKGYVEAQIVNPRLEMQERNPQPTASLEDDLQKLQYEFKDLKEIHYELKEKVEESDEIINDLESTHDDLKRENEHLFRDADEYQLFLRQRSRAIVDICMEMKNDCEEFKKLFSSN